MRYPAKITPLQPRPYDDKPPWPTSQEMEKGYDPSQPRHPAGSPLGGQWAGGGLMAPDRDAGGGGHHPGIVSVLSEEDDDEEFTGNYNPATDAEALEVRTAEDALAHFEWLKEFGDDAVDTRQEVYDQAHAKDAPPHVRAKHHPEYIRTQSREDAFKYALTTELNAVEAVDQAAYRQARHEFAVAEAAWDEKEAQFIEGLVAKGVAPETWYDSFRVHSFVPDEVRNWGRTRDDIKKKFGVMDADIDAAVALHKARPDEQNYRTKWLQAYYGEPAEVKPRYTILGTPDEEMPPGVRKAGGQIDIKTAEFMESADVAIQMKLRGLDRFAGSGKMKNGFEKGAVGSVGRGKRDYFDHRRKREEEIFGIDPMSDGMKRPIYGYLEHPDRMLTQGADIGDNYGGVQVVLKPDVKAKTSFTVGDSLDDGFKWGRASYAVTDPPPPDLSKAYASEIRPDLDSSKWEGTIWARSEKGEAGVTPDIMKPQYIEAQIHGGVFFGDVAEIRIPRNATVKPTTLKKLQKAGIPVVRTPPYHTNVYTIGDYTTWERLKRYKDPGDKDPDDD